MCMSYNCIFDHDGMNSTPFELKFGAVHVQKTCVI